MVKKLKNCGINMKIMRMNMMKNMMMNMNMMISMLQKSKKAKVKKGENQKLPSRKKVKVKKLLIDLVNFICDQVLSILDYDSKEN